MTETALTLNHTIKLDIPAQDQDDRDISTLNMRRPKTRHIRELTALLGPDLVKALFSDNDSLSELLKAQGENLSNSAFADMLAAFLSKEKLEAITDLLADLCNVDKEVIDDIDPVDWPKFVEPILLFFSGPVGSVEEIRLGLWLATGTPPSLTDNEDWFDALAAWTHCQKRA